MSLSLIRLSRIPRLERRQIQRKLRAFRTGFVAPILATPVETFRPTSHCSDTRQHWRAPLSQPTRSRATPIRITALRFNVRLDAEGAKELRIAG